MKSSAPLAALMVATVVLLGACALRSPSIAQLQQDPERFHDKTVRLEGTVTSSWGLPLVPFKLYRIDDGTGELTVVSQTSRIPTRGARVRVKGKVQEVAVLGGRSLGLHLREEDRDIKRP